MTGEELVSLMQDRSMSRAVYKAARRYTKCPEDIEEYMDDAWMRIAEAEANRDPEYYQRQAQRATHASWKRKYRAGVDKKATPNVHGISESPMQEKPPRNAINLGRGRYLKIKPEKLSQWYYDGEWKDYGLDRDGVQVTTFYEIVVLKG